MTGDDDDHDHQEHVEPERGLIVNSKYAHRFFDCGKTWELKTSQCRCVSKGKCFWILESGIGHNNDGLAVFRILGKVQLVCQHKITWETIEEKTSLHCCSPDEIVQLKRQWRGKINLYAWEVDVVEVITPLYIRCSSQDPLGSLQCCADGRHPYSHRHIFADR